MNKAKSAVCLVLMTLLIAGLIFVCFIPFNYGYLGMNRFNPIAAVTSLDPDLGLSYGSGDEYSKRYNGGGYSAMYYPEGIISAREYRDNLEGIPEEDTDRKTEYRESYTPVGSLYFETEKIELENGKPNADFKADFDRAVELLRLRYERLHAEDVRLDVLDDYTVRVFVPRDESLAFEQFSYMGEFSVSYGSSETDAATIMPKRANESINEYVKGAGTRSANGSEFVVIDFTDKGRDALREATANAAESSATMYFKVGDNLALSLSVSSAIDQNSLFITSTSFTAASANISAILIDTALNAASASMTFEVDEITNMPAVYGDSAVLYLVIALAVCVAMMLVFFFIRYHLLAFAHLYTFLLYLCGTVLCIWAIPFVTLSVETVTAVLITTVLMSISDVIVFENARKDYALGKTIVSCVKNGYRKAFWHLFDMHIVLALIGFVTFFIALPPLSTFAFVFGLTTVFSGLGCLVLTRFHWAILMAYTNNKGGFCNFKREVADND